MATIASPAQVDMRTRHSFPAQPLTNSRPQVDHAPVPEARALPLQVTAFRNGHALHPAARSGPLTRPIYPTPGPAPSIWTRHVYPKIRTSSPYTHHARHRHRRSSYVPPIQTITVKLPPGLRGVKREQVVDHALYEQNQCNVSWIDIEQIRGCRQLLCVAVTRYIIRTLHLDGGRVTITYSRKSPECYLNRGVFLGKLMVRGFLHVFGF